MVTPPPAWSTILQDILKTPAERQRLATALNITPMTLSRWATGESKPQKNHLIHLVHAVHPTQRSELIAALEAIYPDIQTWLKEDTSDQIPSDTYAQILNLRTTITEALRFWRISEAIARQALVLLDPLNQGMAIRLLRCMPPSPLYGNMVVSL